MENYRSIKKLEDLFDITPWAEVATIILRKVMIHDTAHDEGHLIRVARNALWFGQDGDASVIVPAALLHDLVNVPKSDKVNRPKASRFSAEAAIELLVKHALSKDHERSLKKSEIFHAIEAHSYSANIVPTTLEARAVQDADRIDSLGLIGITRCFAVSGSMNRALFDPLDPSAKHRSLDDYQYGLDHFKTKLFTLQETMQTERGKAMASRLTKKMVKFYNSLCQEILEG